MPIPTASGLSRFRKCQASAVLPSIRSSSKAAEDGTEIHEFLEKAASVGKEEALKTVPVELRGRCASIDVEAILADFISTDLEAAYALDPIKRTARKLGNSIKRDYESAGKRPEEIGGSEDVIGVLKNGRHCALDYKSGQYLGPASENSQVLYFSSCLYLILDVPEIEARIVYINEDGSHWTDACTFSAFDIEAYLDDLADKCKRYEALLSEYRAGRQITVNPGDWCAYCNALEACPKYTALAKQMLPELASLEQQILALTPENAGRAWLMLKDIEKIADRVSDGLKAYAREQSIPLPNGDVVKESTFSKRFFSQDAAIERILDLGGKQQDVDACFRTKKISAIRAIKNKEK